MRIVHTIPQKWWMSPLTKNHICQTITIPWNWTLLPFGSKLKITMSSWNMIIPPTILHFHKYSKYWFELHNWPFSFDWYVDQTLREFHLSYFKYILQISFNSFQFFSSKFWKCVIFNSFEVSFSHFQWNRFFNKFFSEISIIASTITYLISADYFLIL